MKNEECIVVDLNDNIIRGESKEYTHKFSAENPRGILHRAFSIFLFNSEGKLLLQQRASSKITFPNVWTNTCCSHPLYGIFPSEVDDPAQVHSGNPVGIKKAAIRKLKHELGICEASKVNIDSIRFLTRLHYWAADTATHGSKSVWGEHEIDYILFIQADVNLEPNADEVQSYKYVSLNELSEMLLPTSSLSWSPWFKIIAESFLIHWWKDLNETMTTDKFVNTKKIYRFDPSPNFFGGAGNASEWLGNALYDFFN
jgi:isopentenyl-diphosphate delta-isomerase